jgi:hypothetical protein
MESEASIAVHQASRRYQVKKWVLGMAAISVAAAGAAGCAAAKGGFQNVAVTRDASAVSSCQKVDDVKVTMSPTQNTFSDTSSTTVSRELANAARRKGGNTVLITEDTGMAGSGTVYMCSMPSSSTTGGSSGSK